jgi:quinolinate synthase
MTIADKLTQEFPHKKFYPMINSYLCPNMKNSRITDIVNSLENMEYEIILDPEEIRAAAISPERMVSL